MRRLRIGAIVTGIIGLRVLFGNALAPSGEAGHLAGMDAMSIDVAVSGNSATGLGARQDCLQLSAGASASIDLTAGKVPASNPMVGYTYRIDYPSEVLTVTDQDSSFMLAANDGSLLVNTSDPLPDDNLNDEWNATLLDTGLGTPESGSGVLDRLTIGVEPSAPTGLYLLTLTANGHIGRDSLTAAPDATYHASIAVGAPCDGDGDGWADAAELAIGTSAQQNCGGCRLAG